MKNSTTFSKRERQMLGLSLHDWEHALILFLLLAGIFAVLVGVATWAVVRLQREQIRLSDERISAAELETARIKKEFGPRNLDWNAFVAALKGAAMVQLEILYVADDIDSMDLAQQIQYACSAAGWGMPSRSPIQRPSNWAEPLAMAVDGQPKGVTVVSRHPTPADGVAKAVSDGLGAVAMHSDGPHAPPIGTVRIVVAPKR